MADRDGYQAEQGDALPADSAGESEIARPRPDEASTDQGQEPSAESEPAEQAERPSDLNAESAERAESTASAEGAESAEGVEAAAARPSFSADDFRREIRRVRRKRRVVSTVSVVAVIVIAVLVVGVGVLRIPGSLCVVGSDDMAPMLASGQVVYMQELQTPESGSVIVYRDASGNPQVKRIAALANEWVNITSDDKVVVSATPLEGNSAAGLVDGDATIIASRQVPDKACFVIADADGNALEALYRSDNYVSYNQIIGRASVKIWPPAAIGSIA